MLPHEKQRHHTLRRVQLVMALLIGSLLLTLVRPVQLQAQRLRNKQMALISFDFKIHPDVRNKMLPYEGLFPSLPRRMRRGDPVYARLQALSYEMIRFRLSRDYGVIIMPINTYGKRFKYDDYGFPSVGIELAQRRGDARFYLALEMEIGTAPESISTLSPNAYRDSILRPKDYLRPNITIALTLYPRLGIIPEERYSRSTQWPTPILLQPTMLDGIVNSQYRHDRQTLREAIELAIDGLMEAIKEK